MERGGGLITRRDLAQYQAVEREPVRGTFKGYEIVSMPPPSSGGVHLVQMLNVLEHFPLRESAAEQRGLHPRARGDDEARLRRPQQAPRRSGLSPHPRRRADLARLREADPRRHRPATRHAFGADPARDDIPAREHADHALLGDRRRGQRGLEHLHAELLFRQRHRRTRRRILPQQRDGRFLGEAGRAERLRADRRRGQRSRARASGRCRR